MCAIRALSRLHFSFAIATWSVTYLFVASCIMECASCNSAASGRFFWASVSSLKPAALVAATFASSNSWSASALSSPILAISSSSGERSNFSKMASISSLHSSSSQPRNDSFLCKSFSRRFVSWFKFRTFRSSNVFSRLSRRFLCFLSCSMAFFIRLATNRSTRSLSRLSCAIDSAKFNIAFIPWADRMKRQAVEDAKEICRFNFTASFALAICLR